MMRRSTAIGLLAGVLLAGLIAVPGAPAGAQDIADLPRLGFEIDPNQGNVGDLVEGWVDTDDVQEHCLTFEEFFDGQIVGGNPVGTGELVRLYQDLLVTLDPILLGQEPPPEGLTIAEFEQVAIVMAALFVGLGQDPDNLAALYEALFVLTFVDPVSQEMLGDMGGFDPATGEGSIIVPGLDPGLYAVAAACVGFLPDDVLIEGGAIIDTIFVLRDWIVETYPDGPPSLFDPTFPDFVADAALVWVPDLVEPIAVGIDFYCILQDDGFCATPPGPVGLIDDDVLDEFNGDGPLAPGPDAADLGDLDGVGDLVAVDAAPSFTG